MTDQELLAQIDNSLPPDANATMRIGDRDVSLSDPRALQEAITAYQESMSREIQGLKAINEETRRNYVQPETPVAQPQQNNYFQPKPVPEKYTVEALVEDLKADPVKAIDSTLARALGLQPGQSAAQALQALAASNMAMAQRLSDTEKRFTEMNEQAAAREFMDAHDSWAGGKENEAALFAHLKANNLPYTPQGLHLAYLAGMEAGDIKTKDKAPAQQSFEPSGQAGLPSLRGTQGPATDSDITTLLQRADKMSTQDTLKMHRTLWEQMQQGRR